MPRRSNAPAAAALAAAALASMLPAGAASGRRLSAGPVATAGPTVVGIAATGKRLTGLSGTWAGTGEIAYHFQWYRCNPEGAQCLSIRGATSPTYALVARDVGKAIGLTVSATDSTGTTPAYTSLIGPVAPSRPLLESTVQPAVTGPPVEGRTVEVTTGAWSPTPAKVTYAWERCNANARVCAVIPNATGNLYRLTAADVGHSLLVLVQATFGPTSQDTLSTATPPAVDASVAGPIPVTRPAVEGSPVVNGRLTAGVGTWKAVGAIGFAYQWYRCDTTGAHCGPILGATGATYRLVARDAGTTTGLTVRATDAAGTSVAYTSPYGPIAAASAALTASAQPALTGEARVGERLTAGDGGWSMPPTSYAHTWLRCNENSRLCIVIPGATSASYVVQPADVGHRLIASVQASTPAASQSALSIATARVT